MEKMLYTARQQLIQFLPCWMMVFRVSKAGSFIKQHQTDVPHRVPAALTGNLLSQTLKGDTGVHSAWTAVYLTTHLEAEKDLLK